jgi:hypothetical protein
MNTQEVIWLDSRSIGDPEQIRYVDLAFILCGSSVKTILQGEAPPTIQIKA